tara:strand:- start:35 stop:607 length:573 start_codon:yes stop_codon:yes gene_type:complete
MKLLHEISRRGSGAEVRKTLKMVEDLKSVFEVLFKSTPIIAGGLVRDAICKLPIKDVDVFVRVPYDQVQLVQEILEMFCRSRGLGCISQRDTYCNCIDENDEIFSVITITGSGQVPLDIICTHKDPVQHVSMNFACNASKVYVIDGDIVKTEAFKIFEDTGKLEFDVFCSKEYQERITQKFNTKESDNEQ